VVLAGLARKHLDYMKSGNVIKLLKKQIKAEKAYQETFIAGKRERAKAEALRETKFEKFKRLQDKERQCEDNLIEFLTKR